MALTQTAWCWIYTVPTCNLSLHEWCTTSREIIQVTRNWNLGLKIIVIFLQSKGFLKTIEKWVKNLLICRFCKSHILVANVSQFTNFAGRRLHNWFLDHKLSSNYKRSLFLWFSSKHSQHLSWWNLMQNEWKCQGFVTNCVLENDGSCRGYICWLYCSSIHDGCKMITKWLIFIWIWLLTYKKLIELPSSPLEFDANHLFVYGQQFSPIIIESVNSLLTFYWKLASKTSKGKSPSGDLIFSCAVL